MPYYIDGHSNIHPNDVPFSGVGIEYFPLGAKLGHTGITLHETGYVPDNSNWNFPSVFNPFWNLYHNEHRGHYISISGKKVELTPDQLVLIPSHSLFHCLGETPVPHFWISFSFVKNMHVDADIPVLLTPHERELSLIRDLQTLINTNKNLNPTDTIYHLSLALLLMVLVRPELQWRTPPPDNLAKALKYIEEHVDGDLSNPVLAHYSGMSLASLNRAFQTHMDTPPAVYVTEIRIREACRVMLTTSDKSLEEVSLLTGFPNQAYFSRVFKKVTSIPPSEFRKKYSTRF